MFTLPNGKPVDLDVLELAMEERLKAAVEEWLKSVLQ